MPWIPITEEDLTTVISGPELEGLREAALADGQVDPVPAIMMRVINRIRGDVATSGKYDLDDNPTYIPDRLLDAALSIILMRFMSRPAAAIIDDENQTRAKAAASAEKLLERVAAGNYAIEDPDTGEETSGSAISTVTSNTRHFTRDKMKGL